MNVEPNEHLGATMPKRVHCLTELAARKGIQLRDASSEGMPSLPSTWIPPNSGFVTNQQHRATMPKSAQCNAQLTAGKGIQLKYTPSKHVPSFLRFEPNQRHSAPMARPVCLATEITKSQGIHLKEAPSDDISYQSSSWHTLSTSFELNHRKSVTMAKPVHYATELATKKKVHLKDALSEDMPSPSSSWIPMNTGFEPGQQQRATMPRPVPYTTEFAGRTGVHLKDASSEDMPSLSCPWLPMNTGLEQNQQERASIPKPVHCNPDAAEKGTRLQQAQENNALWQFNAQDSISDALVSASGSRLPAPSLAGIHPALMAFEAMPNPMLGLKPPITGQDNMLYADNKRKAPLPPAAPLGGVPVRLLNQQQQRPAMRKRVRLDTDLTTEKGFQLKGTSFENVPSPIPHWHTISTSLEPNQNQRSIMGEQVHMKTELPKLGGFQLKDTSTDDVLSPTSHSHTMNISLEPNQQESPTSMVKRVRFATELQRKGASLPHDLSPPSSRWYTSKELRTLRHNIKSSLNADKASNEQANGNKDDTCMRGLEVFASSVRRDLQKHYARSVIEAQRRIKACKKRKQSAADGKQSALLQQEDSVLLQKIAAKYSQYARDRAHEVAAKDEVDSRRFHEESCDQ